MTHEHMRVGEDDIFSPTPEGRERIIDFLNETTTEEKIKEKVGEVMWDAIDRAVQQILPLIATVEIQTKDVAAKKSNNYIDLELKWLEEKANELRKYCDANPVSALRDRKTDGKVTATIEQQIKSIRDTLQDYIKILEAIDKLREKEEVKKTAVRGDQELTPMEKGEI